MMLLVHKDACNRLKSSGAAECFLFTKLLNPREVTISHAPAQDDSEEIYLFAEKPNSRLEDKTIFVNHIFSQNNTGAAIYSVPDLILLNANARYLTDSRDPFNDAARCIGFPLRDLIPQFDGSQTEAIWTSVLESRQPFQVTDMRFESRRGTTYWDISMIPILTAAR